MSEFSGCLSSTSFQVKDREAFLADADVQTIKHKATTEGFWHDKDGWFAFGWYGQYPSPVLQICNERVNSDDADSDEEMDCIEVIQRHIAPDSICQIGISGNEKLCYIGGGMWWITTNNVVVFDAATSWETRWTRDELVQTITKLAHELAITELPTILGEISGVETF